MVRLTGFLLFQCEFMSLQRKVICVLIKSDFLYYALQSMIELDPQSDFTLLHAKIFLKRFFTIAYEGNNYLLQIPKYCQTFCYIFGT